MPVSIKKVRLALMWFAVFSFQILAQQEDSVFEYAFPNRLIFSETPEIGFKWKTGVRFWLSGFRGQIDTSEVALPVPFFSVYWNAGNILSLDLFLGGYPSFSTEQGKVFFADNFGLFTIKSRPLDFDVGPGLFKSGGGVKFYWARFHVLDSSRNGLEEKDGSFNPFLSTSYFLHGRHYFNLSLSSAVRLNRIDEHVRRVMVSWCFVPAYRIFLGRQRHWSLAVEYYIMNPPQLPIKVAQYAVDPDDLDFYNPDLYMINYLVWGVSYCRRSLRIDTYIANYVDFSPPFFPFFGVGWNF